jgi:nitroreductase / dihydropteridine reductase
MSIINDMGWRYATKLMNYEIVSNEKLNIILDAANLAPTSYGLQPFGITVVSNQSLKMKLQEASFGQLQVGSCSHALVFTVPLKITEKQIQKYIDLIAAKRKTSQTILDTYKATIMGTISSLSAEQQQNWATRQAYISLGVAMVAAAEQKVDTCPMEGFDAAIFDKILNLTEKGQKAVVMMVLGYRSKADDYSKNEKVRKAREDMFDMIN